ncbi:MAG: septum formation initiator family protein [Rickettsiaceae bacterium]
MLLILVYFVFHSIYGSRGVIAYFKLQAELEQAHKLLNTIRAERLDIENRTKLLRHETLDRDMLDEQIRNVLGLSLPAEKIFETHNNELENINQLTQKAN